MTTHGAHRVLNTAQAARISLENVKRHPLAMDPATVRRLCAESLYGRHCAVVVPFAPPTLDQVAREYLALPAEQRPSGTINRLATERGLNFHQLLRAIGELQQGLRRA